MPDEYLESALIDLHKLISIVDRAEVDSVANPEWAEIEDILGEIKTQASSLMEKLSPE